MTEEKKDDEKKEEEKKEDTKKEEEKTEDIIIFIIPCLLFLVNFNGIFKLYMEINHFETLRGS